MVAQSAIRAENLTKWFGEEDAKTYAVRNACFEAYWGEILYIVGPSGSGKTTLLSMISGILRPNEGAVKIDGHDLWSLSDNAIADFRLNTIGFVFQDYHLFPRLTTEENVAIPLVLQRKNWNKAISAAEHYLGIVGLSDKVKLPPAKLSGGEQQRVAIARAIVHDPAILVLDEPTASLDGETGRKIVSFVKNEILSPKRCILIITHDSRIFEFSDRIMTMEDGRITGFQQGVTYEAREA
jgi:putative ABC transport system ATP-binding protein